MGDFVLDPFVGVGSTLIGAAKNNRKSMGSEKEKKYYDVTLTRLKELKKGTLKLRPIAKQIYNPNENTQVAKIPKQWLNDPKTIYYISPKNKKS